MALEAAAGLSASTTSSCSACTPRAAVRRARRRRRRRADPDELAAEPACPSRRPRSARAACSTSAMTRARAERRARLRRELAARRRARRPRRSPRRRALALGAEWESRDEELFGPAEALHSIFRERRDELLAGVARLGSRLGELRFDTDLDVAHGVVRYLELVKLAALHAAPRRASRCAEALDDVNARLAAARRRRSQREVLQSSPLDELLLGAACDARARAAAMAAREQPTLEAFLPRRGEGLVLSASDVETYLTCPLRYKFARVLRIPREPTLNQRFGILVHHVLERFHGSGGGGAERDAARCSRRPGGAAASADSDEERQLREKARAALLRYHERLGAERRRAALVRALVLVPARPPPHPRPRRPRRRAGRRRLRADRLQDRARPSAPSSCARTSSSRSTRSPRARPGSSRRPSAPTTTCSTTRACGSASTTARAPGSRTPSRRSAAGILAQGFEPTPSYAVCSMCEYRIACPAAEK